MTEKKCLRDAGADVGVSTAVGATHPGPGWQHPQAGTPQSGPACAALSPGPVPH